MMLQQQQHMQQMEQRFQDTMTRAVEAIAKSLHPSKDSDSKPKSTTLPAEIAYSLDQSTTNHSEPAPLLTPEPDTGYLSSAS